MNLRHVITERQPRRLATWASAAFLLAVSMVVILPPLRARLLLAIIPLSERKGPDGELAGQRMRDHLVNCGEAAIGPVIETIRQESAWQRRYAYLPQVLHQLGPRAQQDLVKAIDAERAPSARAYLISSLQVAFNDYSRFDMWLADASSSENNLRQSVFFERDISSHFPDAPPMLSNGKLNEAFIAWWARSDKKASAEE